MLGCGLYLVGLAKLLFPMEAQVVMDIANVDGTCEFITNGVKYSKNMSDAQRKTVDLNEAPFRIQEEHLVRLKALSRTGKSLVFLLPYYTLTQSRRIQHCCNLVWHLDNLLDSYEVWVWNWAGVC